MEFKAYTYTTAEQAEQAISDINKHFGIPVSEDATTQTYTTYEVHEGVIFIRHLPELETILGQPTLITITIDHDTI